MRHSPFFRSFRLWPIPLCLALCCGQAFAGTQTRPVTCVITSGGHTYAPSGCRITQETEEHTRWYVIETADASPLLEEILSVSLVEMSPETAEVSGLTKSGINSRWGRARRDGDCWSGEDFRICIREVSH